MAFRCSACKEPQDPGTKPNKTVTKTREVSYECMSIGTEIVKEEDLCDSCYEKFSGSIVTTDAA